MLALSSIMSSADLEAQAQVGPVAQPVLADFAGKVAVRAGMDAPVQYRVSDEEMRLAREKANAVALYLDLRDRRGLSRTEAARRIEIGHGDRLPLLRTAGRGGKSAITDRNLDEWTRACDGDCRAVEKLVRNYAACGRRERVGDPRFWQYWQALYLSRQQLSVNAAYRAAAEEARREGISDIPTVNQVNYWRRRHIDPGVETLARFGEEAFKAGFQYFIDRDWSDILPGEILFSDHHELDCPCRVWDEAKESWVPCRPTLTAFMDAKSWYIPGWQLSAGAGNSETIMNTLALSIISMDMHTPAYIYTDNGADYLRTGFGQPATYRGRDYSVVDALGLKVVRSLRYRAQAKTIERRFREVCEWFAKRWGGYLGNRPGSRSEIANYYWEHPEELPTLQQLCTAFAAWLQNELHHTPCDGKIGEGRTPAEAWAKRGTFSHQWDRDDLYFAFLVPTETRQVGRGPSVRVDNTYYYSNELMRYIGRKSGEDKVLVYQDRFDHDGRIYVRTYDDRMIECRTKQSIRAIAETDEERAKISEAERFKRKQLQSAYTAIDGLTAGTYKLADPMQRILALRAGEAGRIERTGDRRSVKGGSHLYTHHRLVVDGEASAEPLEFRQTPGERRAVAEQQAQADFEQAAADADRAADVESWDDEAVDPAETERRRFLRYVIDNQKEKCV